MRTFLHTTIMSTTRRGPIHLDRTLVSRWHCQDGQRVTRHTWKDFEEVNIWWPETKELFDREWHLGSKDGELSHSIKLSAENFLCHAALRMSSVQRKIEFGCSCLPDWVCERVCVRVCVCCEWGIEEESLCVLVHSPCMCSGCLAPSDGLYPPVLVFPWFLIGILGGLLLKISFMGMH